MYFTIYHIDFVFKYNQLGKPKHCNLTINGVLIYL